MKAFAIGGVVSLVIACAVPAAARDGEATKIGFKIKNLKGDAQAAAVQKELAVVEGVDTADVVPGSRSAEVTVKEKGSVKLSGLRGAVAKVGKDLEIEEDDIVVVGRVWILTRFEDALAPKGLEALKKLENVEKVEGLAKIPEKEENGYELTTQGAKAVKLGDICAALQTVFEKKSDKAVVDVHWFAAEKKGGKKHG